MGELFGDEDIVVQGRFEGKIRADRTVTVGPTGDLEGNVQARAIVITGKVKGELVASERAELQGSAVVEGSIQASKIIILEGAQLQGSVAMRSGPAVSEEA